MSSNLKNGAPTKFAQYSPKKKTTIQPNKKSSTNLSNQTTVGPTQQSIGPTTKFIELQNKNTQHTTNTNAKQTN
jgi:hypothetical protein